MQAKRINDYKGKKCWKFPVKIEYGEKASYTQCPEDMLKGITWVISTSARDAGYMIRDKLAGIPCVQLEVFGPKGGVAWHSYRGWESAIFEQMCMNREDKQGKLL